MGQINQLLQKSFLTLIYGYRYLISPIKYVMCPVALPCRFHPTCSAYAIEAIKEYGGIKGSYLALVRLLRCHPFSYSGYDPVPPKGER